MQLEDAQEHPCLDALAALRGTVLASGPRAMADAWMAAVDPQGIEGPDVVARRALEADPEDGPLVVELLARRLARGGRPDASGAVIRVLAEDHLPRHAGLHALRGDAFVRAVEGDEAVVPLRTLVERCSDMPRGGARDPVVGFAALAAADLAAMTGDEDAADAALEAARLVPKNRGQEDLFCLVVRKLAVRDERNPTRLVDVAAREAEAVKDRQEGAFTAMQIGLAYAGLGRADEADRWFGEARGRIGRGPDERRVPMVAMLLRALANAGRWEEAEALIAGTTQVQGDVEEAFQRTVETLKDAFDLGPLPDEVAGMAHELADGSRMVSRGVLVNLAVAGDDAHPRAARFREEALRVLDGLGDPGFAFEMALEVAEAFGGASGGRSEAADQALERARGLLANMRGHTDAPLMLCQSLVHVGWQQRRPELVEEAHQRLRRVGASRSEKNDVILGMLGLAATLAEDEATGLRGFFR